VEGLTILFRNRSWLVFAWLHLAVLWAFAIAKPLFDVLADSPEFFVVRRNTTSDIVLFALLLVLAPPTLLAALELALSRWPRLRDLAHLTFVGGLTTALLLQIFKDLSTGPGIVLTALALAGGLAGALLYARFEPARSVLTVLSPAPALFLVLFLFFSPVNDLFASDQDVPVRHDVRASAPVVVVFFDEFSVETLMTPAGKIDARRFPNFAALARSATWFRDATTVSDHTTDAVPALLTGRYPARDALPTASSNPHSLFTLLGGAYSTDNISEVATHLCPTRLCTSQQRPGQLSRLKSLDKDMSIVALHRILPQRLAAKLPAVTQGFGNFAGGGRDKAASSGIPGFAFEDRPGQFARFLNGIDSGHPHRLNFIHVLLPHTAYQYLPSGQSYPAPPGKEIPGLDDNGIWTKDGVLPQLSLERNLVQIGYADRLIGELMRRLRAQGLWDRALVVIAADHGISFRPGASRRTASGAGAPDVLGMPLFVKLPGQPRGRIDDRHATTADVLPTIADALGIDLRWRVDGRSLLGAPRPASDPVVVSVFPHRQKISMPFPAYVRARDAQVDVMRFAAGPAEGWAGVYARGANADLFRRRVASLAVAPSSGLRAQFDRQGDFDSVDPQGSEVPAFVGGVITGGPSSGQQTFAIGVNGVIQGMAQTYTSGGETRFGGLVPPSAFRSGSNDVRLYEITGTGATRRLGPVES
jgi:hypothetical protein